MISWPAIIYFKGDDELTFILNSIEWENDAELHFFPYAENDILIDTKGSVFDLIYSNNNEFVIIKETHLKKTKDEVEELIKQHMACLNQCCVSKLRIPSIIEGILLIEKLNS